MYYASTILKASTKITINVSYIINLLHFLLDVRLIKINVC